VAIATGASLFGAVPALLSAPEDRALAIGLPAIALALGYLLNRIVHDRRPYIIDLACAALLTCPGLAMHGWLYARALDASAWYLPEQLVSGLLSQSAAGGATTGVLWGAAIALAALRGLRALPLVTGIATAGLWLGAGSLTLTALLTELYKGPPTLLLYLVDSTINPFIGAIGGGLLVLARTSRTTPRREQICSVVLGALLTATCTVPLQALVRSLELPKIQTALPITPAGPRTIAPTYEPGGPPSAEDFAAFLNASGHPGKTRPWTPREYPLAPWHLGLRMSAAIALPPDTTRSELDALAAAAWIQNTFRLSLHGRATGGPEGTIDQLLGYPTVDLLLDPAPANAVAGTVHSDGRVTWDTSPPDASPPPHCSLRADADVTVRTLTTVAFRLTNRAARERCRGIGYPPARCHPGGAGDPHCP